MKFDSFAQCKDFIKSDAYRYIGTYKFTSILKLYLIVIGFRYTTVMRICCYLRSRKCLLPIYVLYRLRLRHLSFKSGIQISDCTQIGKGFYIEHFGCIVISDKAIIGNNVNISQGITIGRTNRGEKQGVATIGNEVYIGPGAKIIGKINIGNNITIGANAVVTNDIPDNACVVGVPAKIISYAGSEGYVNRKV